MKKLYLCIASAFFFCLLAEAQDLNPEVKVTNEYEARLADVHKNGVFMTVPDSLTKFTTDIDYSVFETEYRGAYDFAPYFINVAPQPAVFDGKRFYFRAGAGYGFHPVARLVYSPLQRGLVRLTGAASFDGYAGTFTSLDTRPDYSGNDFSLSSGFDVRWDKETFDLSASASYNGIYSKDDSLKSSFHNVLLSGKIRSNSEHTLFGYDIDAKVFYSRDDLNHVISGKEHLNELSFSLGGLIKPLDSGTFKLFADIDFEGSLYTKLYENQLLASFAAIAAFDWDFIDLSLGPRISFGYGFGLYPEFHASTMFGGNVIKLSIDVTGGQQMYGYTALKTLNHWVNPSYLVAFKLPQETVNASLSLSGKMLKRLQYSLSSGYIIHKDGLMDGLTAGLTPGYVVPSIAYADYQEAFGKLLLYWESPRFSVNADIMYRWTDLIANNAYLGVPALTAELSALYNWNNRIYLGSRLKAQSNRASTVLDVPGFVDLGLYTEYNFVRNFALWAQVGNILNQKISYSPIHIAGGVYFTAGICLKLK